MVSDKGGEANQVRCEWPHEKTLAEAVNSPLWQGIVKKDPEEGRERRGKKNEKKKNHTREQRNTK